MPDKIEPIKCPFEIVVDAREKMPYTFQSIKSDAKDGRRLIDVTTQWQTLESGDYSIKGYEQRVSIERKSLEDAFSTFGKGRARFEKELRRLCAFQVSAVVIESDWTTILNDPPEWCKLPRKTVFRSILSWQQRYPTIHWWTMPSRRLAEVLTYRILSRYWRDHAN